MTPYSITIVSLTIIGLLGCLTFIAGYWWVTRGNWIKEEAGRFLMTYTGSVTGLLTILLLNQWIGDWAIRRPVTLLVSVTFVASLWWPLRLLWLAQREKRMGKEDAGLEADVHLPSDPGA